MKRGEVNRSLQDFLEVRKMMHKFSEIQDGKINLIILTGTDKKDSLAIPIKNTLVRWVYGFKDYVYVGGGIFQDTTVKQTIQPGSCNLMSSGYEVKGKYENTPYVSHFAFASGLVERCTLPDGTEIQTHSINADFSREDKGKLHPELLEKILAKFPNSRYRPLLHEPNLR